MKRILLTATAVGVLLGIGAWGETKKHSDVGTWKVDMAHSDFGAGEKPKSLTVVVVKDTPAMLSWRVRGVDEKGKAFAYSWTGPQDGTMHPVIAERKRDFQAECEARRRWRAAAAWGRSGWQLVRCAISVVRGRRYHQRRKHRERERRQGVEAESGVSASHSKKETCGLRWMGSRVRDPFSGTREEEW